MLRNAEVTVTDRFWLLRDWSAPIAKDFPSVCDSITFVMLNPSTADARADDPTIRKCIGFATRLGYSRMHVVNLFSFRATDPRELRANYGNEMRNAIHVRKRIMSAERVVFAWGTAVEFAPEDVRARALLSLAITTKDSGILPWCLGESKSGHPRHPLMLSYTATLTPWKGYDVPEWAFLR